MKKKIYRKNRENYGKTEKMVWKPDLEFGSWLRVGKVLALYNARLKIVPLIKCLE